MDARRSTLREYQQHLIERIRASASTEAPSSHLGFEAGANLWAVSLTEIAEVIPVPALAFVPFPKEWFSGIANVRGNLIAVTDFAHFLGAQATRITSESRLIILHARYQTGAGLLISRSLGLRQRRLSVNAVSAPLPWQIDLFEDGEGRVWRELHVQRLARDPKFLTIAR